MSEFGGLWKHENNQRSLVPPKTECGCPSGGGVQNGHIRYPFYGGTQKERTKEKKVLGNRTSNANPDLPLPLLLRPIRIYDSKLRHPLSTHTVSCTPFTLTRSFLLRPPKSPHTLTPPFPPHPSLPPPSRRDPAVTFNFFIVQLITFLLISDAQESVCEAFVSRLHSRGVLTTLRDDCLSTPVCPHPSTESRFLVVGSCPFVQRVFTKVRKHAIKNSLKQRQARLYTLTARFEGGAHAV